jgi:hypothetical protein
MDELLEVFSLLPFALLLKTIRKAEAFMWQAFCRSGLLWFDLRVESHQRNAFLTDGPPELGTITRY